MRLPGEAPLNADYPRPCDPVHGRHAPTPPFTPPGTVLAKPNYSFEKRQREIAKKKQQDEKAAKKRAARDDAKPAEAPQPAQPGRDPASGQS